MNYHDIGSRNRSRHSRRERSSIGSHVVGIGNGYGNKRKGLRKEQTIMLITALFVLSALTMTGVYVREKNDAGNDGYVVDLSSLEKNVPDKVEEIAEQQQPLEDQASVNDMDVDPAYEEANSSNVQNTPVYVEDSIQIPGVGTVKESSHSMEKAMMNQMNMEQEKALQDEIPTMEEGGIQEQAAASTVKESYQFSDRDQLQWPIVGNVLINYSMDKTVYFPTLDQYKYNPAIVIQAEEGEPVTAAARGEVIKVFQDAEIGNAVTMNIGNGYEVTYGQLKEIEVGAGENIEAGAMIGKVAAPTKYYSVEGNNVYFKVTKDEVPVNPMGQLQ